jgi:hypothetical protein
MHSENGRTLDYARLAGCSTLSAPPGVIYQNAFGNEETTYMSTVQNISDPTNSVEQSPPCEATNRYYSRIPQDFMGPEGSLPYSKEPCTGPYPVPDQSRPTTSSHSTKVHFNVIFLCLDFPSGLFFETLYAGFSPMRATCPDHLILLRLNILIIFGEEQKL